MINHLSSIDGRFLLPTAGKANEVATPSSLGTDEVHFGGLNMHVLGNMTV